MTLSEPVIPPGPLCQGYEAIPDQPQARDGRPPFLCLGWGCRLRHRVSIKYAPIGLLLVADPDHENLNFETEERAGKRDRGTPLTGAGSRYDLLGAGLA